MCSSTTNDFRLRAKWGKQQHYKKHKQINYFNIFNIINILTLLSANAKSAVLLKVPSLTKVEVSNFPLPHFPRWFCLVHGQFPMSLRRVKRSIIHKLQCFCLFNIQQRSVFTKILKALQFFIFIAFGGTSQYPPENVPYWRQQTYVTDTSFLSIFFKILFYIVDFSILTIGKHSVGKDAEGNIKMPSMFAKNLLREVQRTGEKCP